jgi:hypothetical protein
MGRDSFATVKLVADDGEFSASDEDSVKALESVEGRVRFFLNGLLRRQLAFPDGVIEELAFSDGFKKTVSGKFLVRWLAFSSEVMKA